MAFTDAPEEVPIWEMRDGKAFLKRPTCYTQNTDAFLRDNQTNGRYGYIVRNRFGDLRIMSKLAAERMESLFASKQLEVVDYCKSHFIDQHAAAFSGVDTEGFEAVLRKY